MESALGSNISLHAHWTRNQHSCAKPGKALCETIEEFCGKTKSASRLEDNVQTHVLRKANNKGSAARTTL